MRGEVPVRLALQRGEHGLDRCGLGLQQRARIAGKVRGGDGAFLFGAGQVAGRIDDGGERRLRSLGDVALRRNQRFQARRIDDLVVVGEAALAGGVLREPDRQDAERTRRQPDEASARFDAALLQRRMQAIAAQAPERGAEVVDGASPLRPAFLQLGFVLDVVDVVGAEPTAEGRPPCARRASARRACRVVRSGRSRTVMPRVAFCRGHDQDLGAGLGEERRDDGAAAGNERSRLGERGCRPAFACGRALDEIEQLGAQRHQLVDRRRACSALAGQNGAFLGADGNPQLVEPAAPVGGKVEGLQPQRPPPSAAPCPRWRAPAPAPPRRAGRQRKPPPRRAIRPRR